ncbi:MAG: TonB-dependent receptor [Acidobacteriia bacterium]|nr:TonB-dependent receptor [Terriglobia bacterium]
MLRFSWGIMGKYCFLLLLVSLIASFASAQSETATLSGQVVDPSGLNITGAQVKLVDIDRDTSTSVTTKNTGMYTFPSVRPGRYRIEVIAAGFKVVNVTGVTVNVQDHLEQNFKLVVGSVSESITVEGGAPLVDTESATVSTVVDRNFAENLPLNGRSFQTLIQLTPGVVLTANNGLDTGQFSINGQRASSNYWMVDGASANIGITTGQTPGNGMGGALGSSSVLGGTNSLVSVDALQEFRIQTSTFAPEFGRTPGGQISIVTRSGTHQFHGTAFDYVRNDVFDANDWFNGYTNNPPLPKAEERQNDFGGTLSGPILKNRTFFFFSYEGLRLRLPQTLPTLVPDLTARQNALPAVQPFLNAFPMPNGPDDPATNVAQYNASFSNPATLNAYSLRIDHKLSDKLALFGRYDYSPSKISERGVAALSTVVPLTSTTQTGTAGVTWGLSPTAVNDFRFNYSSTDASSYAYLDDFGGAVPIAALPFPNSFTTQNAYLSLTISSLGLYGGLAAGANAHNLQRQINLVDNVALQRGVHALKFGVDFRRLSPQFDPVEYTQSSLFSDVPSTEVGAMFFSLVGSTRPATLLFRNLGIFAQDTWRVGSRLTLTYGLRWDVDFVPSSISGPGFNAVTGFDLSNLSNLALAPAGAPPYDTAYGNVAPRIGLAYQSSQNPNRQTVLRGGFGVFYDLATSEAGNILNLNFYPFGTQSLVFGIPIGGTATFPLSSANAAPPAIIPPGPTSALFAFDPHLKSPRTLQWNVALEQSLGKQQTVTASYIGSAGRRLLQTATIYSPNPNLGAAHLVTNAGTSDYNAFQLQFQRRLSRGLQALASYTWSHSIDTASAGSTGNGSNDLSALNPNVNRGPSDFDRRNAFSIALTYDVPFPKWNSFTNAVLLGWSTENVVQAQSAPPVDVNYTFLGELSTGFATNPRPDIIGSQPFYLYGPQYPGGKSINNTITPGGCPDGSDMVGPFCPPPSVSGLPTRQGNLGRNALRGFGVAQWDFAVHRDFPIRESVKLQFRAELFNLLNHPNFGPPIGNLGTPSAINPQFGQSIQMLG